MFDVTLTIPDLDGRDKKEAAQMFLAAILSADWSQGLVFTVKRNPGLRESVTLTGGEVTAALDGRFSAEESNREN